MNNINYKVLPKIVEKTDESTGMMIHKIYKDTLRYLINTFSNVYYIDKNNNPVKVKCFHANQERAVAKSFVGDNITLPLISISETSSKPDTKRAKYNPILVNDSYWDSIKNRAIRILSLVPRPINIEYSINIWAKYKEDLDHGLEIANAKVAKTFYDLASSGEHPTLTARWIISAINGLYIRRVD